MTALDVRIGSGGPVVLLLWVSCGPVVLLLLVAPLLGTAPALSTLLGGVGAEEEVDDWEEAWEWWEWWEACEWPAGLLGGAAAPVTLERREDALARVCGGDSWWQSQEHSSGDTILVPLGLFKVALWLTSVGDVISVESYFFIALFFSGRDSQSIQSGFLGDFESALVCRVCGGGRRVVSGLASLLFRTDLGLCRPAAEKLSQV